MSCLIGSGCGGRDWLAANAEEADANPADDAYQAQDRPEDLSGHRAAFHKACALHQPYDTGQHHQHAHANHQFPACLVLGREDRGVAQSIVEISDSVVHLPMYGMVNSLNVSTVAAVLLYNLTGKLEYRGGK